MNRRSFFRLAIGAAAVSLISKPMLALAGPIPGTYGAVERSTAYVLGIGRLSTPYYCPGGVLTAKMVRDFGKRMARRYE